MMMMMMMMMMTITIIIVVVVVVVRNFGITRSGICNVCVECELITNRSYTEDRNCISLRVHYGWCLCD